MAKEGSQTQGSIFRELNELHRQITGVIQWKS